jgi:hypothetical protein
MLNLAFGATLWVVTPYPADMQDRWWTPRGQRTEGDKITFSSYSVEKTMGVWQGVSVDFLEVHLGLPCPTLLGPGGGPSAAVFKLYGHPTPNVQGEDTSGHSAFSSRD